MFLLHLVMASAGGLSFDETLAIIALVVNSLQAVVLPITIYLLAVQTRAMRTQTTALVEQSREMTAQTRVFIDTIYSTTFQSLYDAEAHIGELMMTYPEASRFLMSSTPTPEQERQEPVASLETLAPEERERVRWLATAMLDFFEHIWTQAEIGGLPKDIWESWEEYMGKILRETRLRSFWHGERGYYAPGFRGFVDLKVGLPAAAPAMPPLPRPSPGGVFAQESHVSEGPSQVARVLRAVTDPPEHPGKQAEG